MNILSSAEFAQYVLKVNNTHDHVAEIYLDHIIRPSKWK